MKDGPLTFPKVLLSVLSVSRFITLIILPGLTHKNGCKRRKEMKHSAIISTMYAHVAHYVTVACFEYKKPLLDCSTVVTVPKAGDSLIEMNPRD